MNPELIAKVEKVNDMLHQANIDLYHFWLTDILFKWHWWVSLSMMIIPWLVWIAIRKKSSTHRLLFAGAVTALLYTGLDTIGMALGLWGYNSKIVPLIPPYEPYDLSLGPIMTMLFLQFKPNSKPIVKAIVYAAIASFAFQPALQWAGLYNPKVWKHIYSFPILVVIYLIAHFAATRKQFEKL